MEMPHVATYFLPVLVILLSVPLVLGKVPPNGAYGFRTPKTLSSPLIWYPANRVAGWSLIVAGAVALVLNVGLSLLAPGWDDGVVAVTVGPLMLSLIPSYLYLRRLK
jgi:uncharacterized membrane protein